MSIWLLILIIALVVFALGGFGDSRREEAPTRVGGKKRDHL